MSPDKRRKLAALRSKMANNRKLLLALALVFAFVCYNAFKMDAWSLNTSSRQWYGGGADQTAKLWHSVDYLQPDYKPVPQKNKYHVLLPCDGRLYHEWQARVFYYWFKRIKESKDPPAMGGFTRLLHSGEPDAWMDELPTVVVDPLPRDLEKVADGYVMLNRPYAVQQWVQRYISQVPEHFVLLAEPDHVFIRAPPLWATYSRPSGYPFGFMDVHSPKHREIFEKFNAKKVPIKQWHAVGPSPVMISQKQLKLLAYPWLNISFALRQDPEARELFGWTTEMYAFSIAAAVTPGGPKAFTLRPEYMVQPPWDDSLKGNNGRRAAFIHYAYSQDFDGEGTFTPAVIGKYHFDKRDYMTKYPPLKTRRPPRSSDNEASKVLIKLINIASVNLPDWATRAYLRNEPVRSYFGSEGDVLDWADPEDQSGKQSDENFDDEYADSVDLDDIDDIDDIDDEGELDDYD